MLSATRVCVYTCVSREYSLLYHWGDRFVCCVHPMNFVRAEELEPLKSEVRRAIHPRSNKGGGKGGGGLNTVWRSAPATATRTGIVVRHHMRRCVCLHGGHMARGRGLHIWLGHPMVGAREGDLFFESLAAATNSMS